MIVTLKDGSKKDMQKVNLYMKLHWISVKVLQEQPVQVK